MKKLTIIEAERQGPRIKSKKVVKEAINTAKKIIPIITLDKSLLPKL